MHTLSTKPFYRWNELNCRYGSKLLTRLLAAQWLRPCAKSHRLSLYASEDVAAVDGRLRSGELPPAPRRSGETPTSVLPL